MVKVKPPVYITTLFWQMRFYLKPQLFRRAGLKCKPIKPPIQFFYDYMFGGTRMQREQKSKSAFGYDDNKSMIVIGVRYNLFRGIKYNEKASKLQNADRDTGMF